MAVAFAPVVLAPTLAVPAAGGLVVAGGTAAGTAITAEVLLPALAGAALVTAGGLTLAAGGAAMTWATFSKRRIAELRADGLSYREAQTRASEEYQRQKNQEGDRDMKDPNGAELKGVRGLASLRAEIPYKVEASPDLAAAWDIAEGVLDFLTENANPQAGGDAFRRRAAAAHARAKGFTPEHDQTEYEMGRALGEALLLVAGHRGFTADDWARIAPPQLGQQSSFLSRGAEAVSGVDVNNDGQSGGFGDIVSGIAEGVAGGVLPFLK